MIAFLTSLLSTLGPLLSFFIKTFVAGKQAQDEMVKKVTSFMGMNIDDGTKSLKLRDSEQAQLDAFKKMDEEQTNTEVEQ